MTQEKQLNQYDVADWIWSFRFLMLVLIVLAATWTAVVAMRSVSEEGDSSSSFEAKYELKVEIFSAGTPIRDAAEISDILGSNLQSKTLSRVSVQGASPVTFVAASEADAFQALEKIQGIEDQLYQEIQTQADMISSWLNKPTSLTESASAQYLRDLAFLAGTNSDLIDLLRPSVIEGIPENILTNPASPGFNTGRFILPWAVAAFAFLIIAGTATFLKGWHRHREAQSHLEA